MSKAKLFLRDFITGKTVRKYGVALILFIAAAYYWRYSNPGWVLGAAAMSGIGLSVAFMTTLYSIFSYAAMDRIRAYLMLPIRKSEVFFSFVFAQYFTLLLERMSFVIVAAIFFTAAPAAIIACLLLSSLVTVLLDTVFMMGVNGKRYPASILALILIAALYGLLAYVKSYTITLAALAALLLVSVLLTAAFDPKHLAVNREGKASGASSRRVNYFFIVMLRERVVLVNTLGVLAIAGVFAYMFKDIPILLSILWGAVAMNTPATTMFSGDKALRRQERMLPRYSRLMSGAYASFLGVYFAAANTYVMLLFAMLGRFNIYAVFTGIVFAALETAIALLLERKYPLTIWQKKQEVWRNPRKYILPLIICAIALSPYLLGI